MRELNEQEKKRVKELLFDTAEAVAEAMRDIVQRFMPRAREVHLIGCSEPTHPEQSIVLDSELNVLVAAGVVFTTLLRGLPPEMAARVARAISGVLGDATVTYERLQPTPPKARA